MDIATLTPALLKRTLQALRQAQPPPAETLELVLLDDPRASSRIAREHALHLLLTDIITTALLFHRRAEGLTNSAEPPARDTQRAEIALDFGRANPDLEAWSVLYHRYVTPLPFTPDDLASAAHVEGHTLTRRLNQGLDYLTAELRRRELAARQSRRAVGQHLPEPEYAHLFGMQATVETLLARLSDANGPRFLSIEGLGGAGKTALAHQVAATMLTHAQWEDVLWVSARQEYFNGAAWLPTAPPQTLADIVAHLAQQVDFPTDRPAADQLRALKTLWATAPYLVVIDNLETLAESEALLPALRPLAGVTRFLLTSREALAERYADVYAVKVTELAAPESAALVHSELARRALAVPTPDFAARLYAMVGGNPLALKLATAQVGKLPVDAILADLQRPADAAQAAQLYRHIYRRTWTLLNEPAKDLLYTLLDIDPEGEDLAFIQRESGLAAPEFAAAWQELQAYSLLEVHSWKTVARYRLHRLTVTFLRTDILGQWTP